MTSGFEPSGRSPRTFFDVRVLTHLGTVSRALLLLTNVMREREKQRSFEQRVHVKLNRVHSFLFFLQLQIEWGRQLMGCTGDWCQ